MVGSLAFLSCSFSSRTLLSVCLVLRSKAEEVRARNAGLVFFSKIFHLTLASMPEASQNTQTPPVSVGLNLLPLWCCASTVEACTNMPKPQTTADLSFSRKQVAGKTKHKWPQTPPGPQFWQAAPASLLACSPAIAPGCPRKIALQGGMQRCSSLGCNLSMKNAGIWAFPQIGVPCTGGFAYD